MIIILLKTDELSRQILHCEAKAVFTHNTLMPIVQEALQRREGKEAQNRMVTNQVIIS